MNTPVTPSTAPASPCVMDAPWSRRQIAIVWAATVLSLILRVAMFAGNRALWLDEAMMAVNLKEKSAQDLMHPPLDYVQVGAIGYLQGNKLLVNVLGPTEYAMRLIPLVAGCLAIIVFYRACRLMLSPKATIIALLFLGLCEPQVYYSSEVRPYSLDVLATVTLLWLSLRMVASQFRMREILILGAASIVALLLSMTSIFIVTSCYLCLAVACWRQHRHAITPLIIGGAASLTVFAVHFLSFLKMQTGEYKEGASAGFFERLDAYMPVPPRSLSDLEWFVRMPLDFFVDPGGFKAYGLMLGAAIIGLLAIWKARRIAFAFLFVPFLVALTASALQQYPLVSQGDYSTLLMGRFNIYLVPLAIVAAAAGLALLIEVLRPLHRWAGYGIVIVALAHPALATVRQLRSPTRGAQDIRPCMAYLQDHLSKGDLVVMGWMAEPAFRYYRDRYALTDATTLVAGEATVPTFLDTTEQWVRLKDWVKMRRDLDAIHAKRVWVLVTYHECSFGYADNKYMLQELGRRGIVERVVLANGAVLYQCDISSPRPQN